MLRYLLCLCSSMKFGTEMRNQTPVKKKKEDFWNYYLLHLLLQLHPLMVVEHHDLLLLLLRLLLLNILLPLAVFRVGHLPLCDHVRQGQLLRLVEMLHVKVRCPVLILKLWWNNMWIFCLWYETSMLLFFNRCALFLVLFLYLTVVTFWYCGAY